MAKPGSSTVQSQKSCFPELVYRPDAPGRSDPHGIGLELLAGLRIERGERVRDRVRSVEACRIDVHSELFELLSFLAPFVFDTLFDTHYLLSDVASILAQTASSTPFTKLTASGAEKRFAISSASFMTTRLGVSVSRNS